jgi:hypothetical protein
LLLALLQLLVDPIQLLSPFLLFSVLHFNRFYCAFITPCIHSVTPCISLVDPRIFSVAVCINFVVHHIPSAVHRFPSVALPVPLLFLAFL